MKGGDIYIGAGWKSLCLGSGRPEFHKGQRHQFPQLLEEGAQLAQVKSAKRIDAAVIGNFMAPRFLKQGHLAGFLPHLLPSLKGKPCYRAEAACASGGIALQMGARFIRSGEADVVYVCGFEIQNTLRPLYGADVLAGAGDYLGQRRQGDAYFFPGVFSKRALAYAELVGEDTSRRAMARWYEQSIVHARHQKTAQEYHNDIDDLLDMGMTSPAGVGFLPGLNLYDCSKYSDGAASLLLMSEKGLESSQLDPGACLRLLSASCGQADICDSTRSLLSLDNSSHVAQLALREANLSICDMDYIEVHDCFTITGLLALEALGLAPRGEAAELLIHNGFNLPRGQMLNAGGGLIGWGHPTGATGVRQLVDLLENLAGSNQHRYGLALNMGGDDVSASVIVAEALR